MAKALIDKITLEMFLFMEQMVKLDGRTHQFITMRELLQEGKEHIAKSIILNAHFGLLIQLFILYRKEILKFTGLIYHSRNLILTNSIQGLQSHLQIKKMFILIGFYSLLINQSNKKQQKDSYPQNHLQKTNKPKSKLSKNSKNHSCRICSLERRGSMWKK